MYDKIRLSFILITLFLIPKLHFFFLEEFFYCDYIYIYNNIFDIYIYIKSWEMRYDTLLLQKKVLPMFTIKKCLHKINVCFLFQKI